MSATVSDGGGDAGTRRTKRGPGRVALRWAARLAIFYALWCAALFFVQDGMIFPRKFTGPGGPAPTDATSVWTSDGPERAEAWVFAPALDTSASAGAAARDGRRPAVLFFHGNAELIDDNALLAREYVAQGFVAMLAEYRGYGRSGGSPSQRALVADAERFHALLTSRTDVDPARVVLHGRSLGTGVAAQLAERLRAAGGPVPAGLILESPFTSVASFAGRYLAPGWLVRHPFRTDAVLPGLVRAGVPVLILHAEADTITPPSHALRLEQLAREASREAAGAGNGGVSGVNVARLSLPGDHNSFPGDVEAYWNAIEAFVAPVLRGR